MQLIPITEENFSKWKVFREAVYDTIDDAYNEQEMKNIFHHKDWYCRFVLDEDSHIIGLVEISLRNIVDGCLSSPVAYLEGLYLEHDYRDKGYGNKVVNMIVDWCREKGFKELATDTELTNTKAQNFYRTLGFEELDTVVEFRIDIVNEEK